MAVTALINGEIRNSPINQELRLGAYTATLAGALVMQKSFPPLLVLDPGGAGRNVDLPAEEVSKGLMFVIANTADAAEDLTVRNDAAATIGTVSQNEAAIFVCDGTVWRALVGGNT